MKVAIVCDVFDEHSGARVTPALARALARLSPSDEFVVLAARNLAEAKVPADFPHNLRLRIFKKGWLISFDLISQLQKEKIDLVSAHCSLRVLVSVFISGLRIVRTDYGSQFPSLNSYYEDWQVGPIKSFLNLIGDFYVYLRDFLKFVFSHRNLGISRDNCLKAEVLYGRKVGFIYLGADSLKLPPEAKPEGGDKVTIVSISRFVPYKGFHVLIKAFQKLLSKYPFLRLTLIGSQADPQYFKFLNSLLTGSTEIKLILNPTDDLLAKILFTADIYASATRWEALGLPFLEASFLGLPTLAFSSFGPAAEVIKEGETGFLAKDFDDFVDKLEKLIARRELRQRLGEKGKEFAAQFTWSQTAQAYLEIFKQMAAKS